MNVSMLFPVLPDGGETASSAAMPAEPAGVSFAALFAALHQQIAGMTEESEANAATEMGSTEAEDAGVQPETDLPGSVLTLMGMAFIPEQPGPKAMEKAEAVLAEVVTQVPADVPVKSDSSSPMTETSVPLVSPGPSPEKAAVGDPAVMVVNAAVAEAETPPVPVEDAVRNAVAQEVAEASKRQALKTDLLSGLKSILERETFSPLRQEAPALALYMLRPETEAEVLPTALDGKSLRLINRSMAHTAPKDGIESLGITAHANGVREAAPHAPPESTAPVRAPLETIEAHTVRGVRYLLARGERTLTVRLIPESLGELRIEIHAKGDELSIRLASMNPVVRDTLEQQTGSLREALMRGGIDAGKVEISAHLGHHAGNNGAPSREAGAENLPHRGMTYARDSYSSPASGTVASPRRAVHEGILNVFV